MPAGPENCDWRWFAIRQVNASIVADRTPAKRDFEMKTGARFVLLGFGFLAAMDAFILRQVHASSANRRIARVGDSAINIADDSGGYVSEYASRVDQLRGSRLKIKFTGRCDSSCTLLLALPASQTCITPEAYFRFHAPSAPSERIVREVEDWMMKSYPARVRAWIKSRGGWSPQLVTMDFSYASKFLPICPRSAGL